MERAQYPTDGRKKSRLSVTQRRKEKLIKEKKQVDKSSSNGSNTSARTALVDLTNNNAAAETNSQPSTTSDDGCGASRPVLDKIKIRRVGGSYAALDVSQDSAAVARRRKKNTKSVRKDRNIQPPVKPFNIQPVDVNTSHRPVEYEDVSEPEGDKPVTPRTVEILDPPANLFTPLHFVRGSPAVLAPSIATPVICPPHECQTQDVAVAGRGATPNTGDYTDEELMAWWEMSDVPLIETDLIQAISTQTLFAAVPDLIHMTSNDSAEQNKAPLDTLENVSINTCDPATCSEQSAVQPPTNPYISDNTSYAALSTNNPDTAQIDTAAPEAYNPEPKKILVEVMIHQPPTDTTPLNTEASVINDEPPNALHDLGENAQGSTTQDLQRDTGYWSNSHYQSEVIGISSDDEDVGVAGAVRRATVIKPCIRHGEPRGVITDTLRAPSEVSHSLTSSAVETSDTRVSVGCNSLENTAVETHGKIVDGVATSCNPSVPTSPKTGATPGVSLPNLLTTNEEVGDTTSQIPRKRRGAIPINTAVSNKKQKLLTSVDALRRFCLELSVDSDNEDTFEELRGSVEYVLTKEREYAAALRTVRARSRAAAAERRNPEGCKLVEETLAGKHPELEHIPFSVIMNGATRTVNIIDDGEQPGTSVTGASTGGERVGQPPV